MRVRGWVGLVGVAGLMLGCRSEGNFECSADSQCMLEGVAGYCETTGFCSFPDPTCASTRRYGQLAGDLAKTCVPAQGSTGMLESSSTQPPGTEGSTTGPSPSSTDAATASTTGTLDTTDTSETTGTTSAADSSDGSESSSTAGPFDPGCDVGLLDFFDGPQFDPAWTVDDNPWSSSFVEGAAQWTVGPGRGGFSGVGEPDPDGLDSVAVVIDTPPTGSTRQVFLQLQVPEAGISHALVLSGNSMLEARANAATLESVGVGPGRIELRLALEFDQVHYQYRAEDDDGWFDLTSSDLLAPPSALEPGIAVGSYASLDDAAVIRLDRYLRCAGR